MFTIDTESGFEDAVFITSAYGLGEGVVQGAVNPDEFYVYKPALRDGRPAVLKRGVGDKATKMVYTDDATVGRTTEFVDVEPEERRRLSLTDDEVEELARHALVIEEHYGRPMDIEWGKDGVDGGLYVLQARPETVQSRGGRRRAVQDAEGGHRRCRGAGRGPGDRPEDRCRRRPGADLGRADARVQRGRGAHRRHDRPRLGADHEARRRDRHQPRRPHLPRRDHRPRARHPRGGRHRLGDQGADRRPRGDRLVRRGRHRLRLRRPPRLHRRADRAVRDAGHPGQDHDERRDPGPGVRVRPAAARRGSGWPGSSSSSTGRSASTPRPCSSSSATRTSFARRRAARRDQGADRGLPGPARVLRAARGRGRLDAGGGVRAAPGHRADVGLQVQRVRQPARRSGVRAGRGEPDDRLPRRLAVPLRRVRGLLRDGVRGAAARARRHGAHQRVGDDPVRPHRWRRRVA